MSKIENITNNLGVVLVMVLGILQYYDKEMVGVDDVKYIFQIFLSIKIRKNTDFN